MSETTGGRKDIVMLSPPTEVSMGAEWFELVDLDHFWIIRRLEVLKRVFGDLLNPAWSYGEVGCGHGIVQQQFEQTFHIPVDGLDLNLGALSTNKSSQGTLYHYDILERRPEMAGKYDCLILFDVLEHITDQDNFLQACLHHLKPGGTLLVNVPAQMGLFSKYDEVVGHIRRYSWDELAEVAKRGGMALGRHTYWGLPFYPLLLIRKRLVANLDASLVIKKGMDRGSPLKNKLLLLLSRLEILPQGLTGTSLMAAFRKTT